MTSKEQERWRKAILGNELYERCQQGRDGKVTDTDLKNRLKILHSLYRDAESVDNAKSKRAMYTNEDIYYIRKIISTPFGSEEFSFANEGRARLRNAVQEDDVKLLRQVCELQSSNDVIQEISQMFMHPWWYKAKREQDPVSGLLYIEIPQGAPLFHGTSFTNTFTPSNMHIPAYFGTYRTATVYAFGNDPRYERLTGKVNMYKTKQPVRIVDLSKKENWKILMPSRRSVPTNELRKMIKSAYGYPITDRRLKDVYRYSNFDDDAVVHKYVCELVTKHNFDGVGYSSISGHHDEIIMCSRQALSKLHQMPYKVIVNELYKNRKESECMFVVEDRPGKPFKYLTAVHQNYADYGVQPFKDASDEYRKLSEYASPLSADEKSKLKRMCAEQVVGFTRSI